MVEMNADDIMIETAIRQAPCPGCGAGSGSPCVRYPAGVVLAEAHQVRYLAALDKGILPTIEPLPVRVVNCCGGPPAP